MLSYRFQHLACFVGFMLFYNMGFTQEIRTLKSKKNQFLLSINNGIAFNKFNIMNNSTAPSPIAVPESTTYKPSMSIDYQRTTRYGMIYGLGIQYGTYNHAVNVNYPDFSYVDTFKEAQSLGSYSFQYRNKTNYLGLRLFVGYTLALNKKDNHPFYVDAKIGITKRFYMSGGHSEDFLGANIIARDTIFVYNIISAVSDTWGNDKSRYPNFLEYYIGVRKRLNCRYISDVSIGLFGTYQFEIPGVSKESTAETMVRSSIYLHGDLQYGDYDYYYNRELTFGIRAGFGLSF